MSRSSLPSENNGLALEGVLAALEVVRDQRDALYCQSVQPRRDVERALRSLQGDHDVPAAIDFLEDASRGLHSLAQLYRDQTGQSPYLTRGPLVYGEEQTNA